MSGEFFSRIINPARDIKRRKITHAKITVPARDHFQKLVDAIRFSDVRPDSQRKAKAGADLVELPAYSGRRVGEATALRWCDVSWERNCITRTGGENRTKNNENRTAPMTTALRELLLRLQTIKPKTRSNKSCRGHTQTPHGRAGFMRRRWRGASSASQRG